MIAWSPWFSIRPAGGRACLLRRRRAAATSNGGRLVRRRRCASATARGPAGSRSRSPRRRASSTRPALDVELTYFVDYTASLDALVAGKVDVNAQTLNDTIFGVAAGSDQTIVVVNDNSTGNDAVICDSKITSVKDLKGKKIAAEAGVVDHFLLLQGLAKEGLSEESDIEFPGSRPTRPPRRSPAGSSTASPCSPPSPCRRSSGRARRCCSARRTSPA